jgi:hypothetical protein
MANVKDRMRWMWDLQKHRGERLRERTGGAVFDMPTAEPLYERASSWALLTVGTRVMTYACVQLLFSKQLEMTVACSS